MIHNRQFRRIASVVLAMLMLLGLGIPGLQHIQSASAAADAWGVFGPYYASHGGLRQHGYALTGPVCEIAENGVPLTTQYFERSIFEHHPEYAGSENEVLLKRVGAYLLEGRTRGAVINPNGPCGAATGRGDGGLKPPVNQGGYKAITGASVPAEFPYGRAGYDSSFENGDFEPNIVDLPQWYWRVITAGTIKIPGVADCQGEANFGCMVLLVNHFGDTARWDGAYVDSGFTGAGRIWDMSGFDNPVVAAQALTNHYVDRMTAGTPGQNGANCGRIAACRGVIVTVVFIGNGEIQHRSTFRFTR